MRLGLNPLSTCSILSRVGEDGVALGRRLRSKEELVAAAESERIMTIRSTLQCFLLSVILTSYCTGLTQGVSGSPRFAGPSPWYDITSPAYGAKCDGLADDTLAIQAAIDAAKALGGAAATVYVPAGVTCVYSRGLRLYNSVTIKGAGEQTLGFGPTLKYTGTASPSIACGAPSCTYDGIKNLVIAYSDAGFTGVLVSNTGSRSGPFTLDGVTL